MPPGTETPIDESSMPSEHFRPRVWPVPLLIGVAVALVLQLNTVAVVAAMVSPPAGIAIGAGIVVGNAVANAAVFRGWTSGWHPLVSALLALLPAAAFWGPVFGVLPSAFGLVAGGAWSLLAGAVVGGLAAIVLPGRWRLVGVVAAAVVALALLVPSLAWVL